MATILHLGKFFLLFILSISHAFSESNELRLAITTTTENSGLMSILNPLFEKQTDIRLKVVTAGSGQALRLGRQGNVDVLLTHAPEDEKVFMANGYGSERLPVMHNDFILLGPDNHQATLIESHSIISDFRLLPESGHRFISRGDDSGTHKKEHALWQQSGITPSGEWYVEAGLGMGTVLLMANEQGAYTLTDRGTYLAFKDRIDLVIHQQGDSILHNPYHIISVNPDQHPDVNSDFSKKYVEFITRNDAKEIINNFKFHGQQLFYPAQQSPTPETGTELNPEHRNYFLEAMLSSFRLIVNLDRPLFDVVWTSLKVSLIAVLIATLFSIPLGIVVALRSFFGKQFLLACLNTLMALPTVVVGLLLYGLLNRQGLLGDWSLLYTPTAMVIGQCVLITPIIWNLSIAAVNGADPRIDRICASLGANYLQRILIYMSEVRFALIAAVVTGFGRAIGEVGIAMMLGGNIHGYTRTMTTAIALETSKGDFEFALALGMMLLLVAFIVNAILQQFQLRTK